MRKILGEAPRTAPARTYVKEAPSRTETATLNLAKQFAQSPVPAPPTPYH